MVMRLLLLFLVSLRSFHRVLRLVGRLFLDWSTLKLLHLGMPLVPLVRPLIPRLPRWDMV